MLNQIKKYFTRGLNNPAVPLTSPQVWDYLAGQNTNSAGVSVNNESVLGSAGVWRAVNLISSSIARLPCIVYKRQSDGGRTRASNHAATALIKSPAPYITNFVWMQTMMSHAITHGNGFAYIYRNFDGSPQETLILDPQRTTAAKENGNLIYVTQIGNETRKLLYENVIHFKGLSYDGLSGYPVMDILKETFGHGLALLKYGNIYFKNAGNPNVVISLPSSFKDEEALERFRRSWGTMHTGLDNAHKVAILENGAAINKFNVTNEDAQWLASREFDLKALANVFGLPPHKLGANNSTSYGSLEQENRSFLNDSLGGWLAMVEQELESKLLTEVQKRNDTHFIEFLRAGLEQADLLQETNALVLQVNNGLLSLDEARQILNRPLLPDGLGQAHRIPLQLGELGKEPPAPAPIASPEPPVDPNKAKDSKRLEALTQATLQRLIQRMAKDSTWERTKHESVIADSLSAFTNSEKFVSDWLDSIDEELGHVLPEQRKDIFTNINIEALAKRLLND